MTHEEIIQNRKSCLKYLKKAHGVTPWAVEVTEKCIEALEKQIPKKPKEYGDDSYLCPTCHRNNFYERGYLVKDKYCFICGQAIDWECE